MPKTVPPGRIDLPGLAAPIEADVVPDSFDARDFVYRPRLDPLPPAVDQRDHIEKPFVLRQEGQSGAGHAVATMINTILAQQIRLRHQEEELNRGLDAIPLKQLELPRVSPYMLYRLGRRYDEFAGEDDIGTSLRGVLKGWYYHGVALESVWPFLDMDPEPDIDDLEWMTRNTADRPLGAYYRVNALRLDDVQSAISELQVVVVSAAIHDGWVDPVRYRNRYSGKEMHLIRRDSDATLLGGHGFAIVGYNEEGFLVQNSWGPNWGNGGYATLAYEDWLDSVYDVWVARPGVPQTPFSSGRKLTTLTTSTATATATTPGPDLRRLSRHVVNLGNDGKLSNNGRFISTPNQIDAIFQHAKALHDHWLDAGLADRRDFVFYAHGGLNDEASGLATAEKHLNWWLNNRVYPIYFAWQTGETETLVNQVIDTMKGLLPGAGLGLDLVENVDRLVELTCRTKLRWVWEEMKQNARDASAPIKDVEKTSWPPRNSGDINHMAGLPGASLTVSRLQKYIADFGDTVNVHVAGHSAGAVFAAALIERLAASGTRIETAAFLAGGLRVDDFHRIVFPQVGNGTIRRLFNFCLSHERELSDSLGIGGVTVYHKSLLYLVSRGFEVGSNGTFQVPLIGLERSLQASVNPGLTIGEAMKAVGAVSVLSPTEAPSALRSDAVRHGDFDDDSPTMTSVVMNIKRLLEPLPENSYRPHAALNPKVVPGSGAASTAAGQPGKGALGETVLAEDVRAMAEIASRTILVEVADSPRSGSPTVDMLAAQGWEQPA